MGPKGARSQVLRERKQRSLFPRSMNGQLRYLALVRLVCAAHGVRSMTSTPLLLFGLPTDCSLPGACRTGRNMAGRCGHKGCASRATCGPWDLHPMTQTSRHFPLSYSTGFPPTQLPAGEAAPWPSDSVLCKGMSQDHQGWNKAADSRNKSRFPVPGLSSQERPRTCSPPRRTGSWSRDGREVGATARGHPVQYERRAVPEPAGRDSPHIPGGQRAGSPR